MIKKVKDNRDYKTDGLVRLEKNVRAALRAGRDTVVLRIIRYLHTHVEATKEEIKRECSVADFGHYDKWAREQGRYKIVIPTTTKLYKINPEISDIVSLTY